MRITFLRDSDESYAIWIRTLTLSGERGRFEVALSLSSTKKGERVALSHELRREDIVRLQEGLASWLASADSHPECSEPGCDATAMQDSDFCCDHQE